MSELERREVRGCTEIRAVSRLGPFVVHRAVREGRPVALLVAVGEGSEFVRTFRRIDAAVAGGALDVFTFEGMRAVVRPWVEGEPLDRAEKRALLATCSALEPVADVLGRMHRAGYSDRALSPARVLVGADCRLVDATLAAMGELPMVPSHASPEQLERRHADPRADVYALALLFLGLASGRPPYGEIDGTALHAHATDRARRPSLRALGVHASPRVERVLQRALAVDPELRFHDVDSFWESLRGAVVASPATEFSIERRPLRAPESAPHEVPAERAPMTVVVPLTIAAVVGAFAVEGVVRRVRAPASAPASASAIAPEIATASASASAPAIASASAMAPASASASVALVRSSLMLPVPAEEPVFFVDRTEVTVGAFRACVSAGACKETLVRNGAWSESDPVRKEWLCNYHRKGREDHPVNCISLAQAKAYCAFVGKRLPTGAEWTRAAMGDDKRAYPWGDALPKCGDVVYARYGPDNFGCRKRPVGTEPVGRVASASPFGAEDMAGSLWEWTTDVSSNGLPILRGGAWDSPERAVTIESKLEQTPANADITLGFRCVRDP